MVDKQNVNISLTKDEALVLFDFLGRFNSSEHNDMFDDQAEQKVLFIIETQLEKNLAEPFSTDYLNIINEARNKVRDVE